MKKRLMFFAALAVAATGLLGLSGGAAASGGSVVYNNIPSPQPGNVASQAFEATSTSEFGGQIQLAGTQRLNPTVTVLMSSWGCETGTWTNGLCSTTSGATFSEPVKLSIYNVGSGDSVGTLVTAVTQTFNIPYRPSADIVNCTGANAGKWYSASDSTCYNGFATPISFSLTGVTLPSTSIVSVAYSTTHYGAAPFGESAACFTSSGGCGYDSLNVGVDSALTVGTDPRPNDAYLNSSYGPAYCDGGAGGFGTFRLDSGCWTGYQPAIEVLASPSCTHTGFFRDGIDLTAAQINPAGTVSGTVDASGCNIGVYYGPGHTGAVGTATISGANYYGVVVDRAAVNVSGATIQNIGETQPNGSQHGVGVLYTTIELSSASNDVFTTAGHATGTLSGSTITTYQKNGVVVSGLGTAVTLLNNVVTGFGPITYIAQNGIQISFDATAKLSGNNVSLNNYSPAKVTACGLLLYKAGGVSGDTKTGLSFIKADNNFHNNETDLCNFGKGGGFSPA